jgi:hypothetical protein
LPRCSVFRFFQVSVDVAKRVLVFASRVIQYYSEDMHVKRVSILLIGVALITGMAGCNQPSEYTPMVAAGLFHTAGLKSDGTVVAVGWNEDEQCDVGGWDNITQVAADNRHTVGLRSDGTVVAVGWNDDGQCDVDGWDLN